MNIEYRLIGIPASVWSSWPKDRKLSDLANDALGMERRIIKGVNAGRERFRYMQTCEHMESLALQLAREGSALVELRLTNADARRYAALVEALSTTTEVEMLAFPKDAIALTSAPLPKAGFLQRILKGVQRLGRATVAETSESDSSGRRHPIGKSFYPPGVEVKAQREAFERIYIDKLLIPGFEAEQPYDLATKRAEFFRNVEQQGGAVIEIATLREEAGETVSH